ncbi:MAG: hypothetical protein QM497_01575 [Sulfurimonas sp.]
MVRVFKILAYILFFILAVVYFMPKSNLYYFAEQELQKQKVVISDETTQEEMFSLELQNAVLSYASVDVATISKADIGLFVLYNTITLHDVNLSSMASAFVPLHVNTLEVKYTILNPLTIYMHSKGAFGEADAMLHIKDRNITILLKPSSLMQKQYVNSMRKLKKNNNGEYEYAKNF